MLTPSLQQRYHTGGKQNTCWLKPDKATLGFRSCTANRSYLYAAPGSRSNPERDEFTPAQTCKAASTFPLATEISAQTVPSAPHCCAPTATPQRLPGCWALVSRHTCVAPAVSTSCRIHCWHGALLCRLQPLTRPCALGSATAVARSRQQTVPQLQLHIPNCPDCPAWPPARL